MRRRTTELGRASRWCRSGRRNNVKQPDGTIFRRSAAAPGVALLVTREPAAVAKTLACRSRRARDGGTTRWSAHRLGAALLARLRRDVLGAPARPMEAAHFYGLGTKSADREGGNFKRFALVSAPAARPSRMSWARPSLERSRSPSTAHEPRDPPSTMALIRATGSHFATLGKPCVSSLASNRPAASTSGTTWGPSATTSLARTAARPSTASWTSTPSPFPTSQMSCPERSWIPRRC